MFLRVTGRNLSFLVLLFALSNLCGSLPLNEAGAQTENKLPNTETSPPANHPILVELFTSEGCSSCPPADAFLEKIDASQPVPNAQLIVLSEHVDYWDHDGWKDPHSSAELTARQNEYVQVFGLRSPFTPQFIVDGTRELRANDPQQIGTVFKDAAVSPKIPMRIEEVSVDPGNPNIIRAHLSIDRNSGNRNADIYLAAALDRVESQVLHGENGGRHLTHIAVAVQLTRVGKLGKGKSFDETVQLKLKPGTDLKNLRIIAFAQESGPGKVLGAALKKIGD
jgi:hypothetical protein